ncbi:MAG TPA: acyltransferase [Bryobacteraceae bacterium]
MPRGRSASHIPELDGIRGIAILAVLIYHLFNYTMVHRHWTGAAYFIMRITEHGARGVDLFFVLSGFLITGILLDTRSDPHYFRNFYARRALRILPLYYSVLLVVLFAYPHTGKFVLLSFFHLSNIAPILGLAMVNGAVWSLSVEEHFYLFWPQVVWRVSSRSVAIAAAGICVAEPIIRGLAYHHVASVFPYTWFRLDGLACGALIACGIRSRYYSRRDAVLLAIALAACGILSEVAGTPFAIRNLHTRLGATFAFSAVNLICSAIVLWGAAQTGTRQTRFLRSTPLRVCGDLSYCVYLIHLPLVDAYNAGLSVLHLAPALTNFEGVLMRAVVVTVVSLIIAAISRKVLEGPALSLKRYFVPRVVEQPEVVSV